MLKHGHVPAKILHSEIQELKQAVESGALQRSVRDEESLNEMPSLGNSVEFRYGPFAGRTGVVERVDVRKKNKRPAVWIRIGSALTKEDGCERLKVIKQAA